MERKTIDMRISSIKIINFRALRSLEFCLDRDFSVFVGRNNTGKTSIMAALERFLSNSARFAFSDFNGQFLTELCAFVLGDAAMPQPCGIALLLTIDYANEDDISCLYPALLDLDPKNNSISLEFSYAITAEGSKKLKSSFDDWCKDTECDPCSKEAFIDYLKTRHGLFFSRSCMSVAIGDIADDSFSAPLPKKLKREEVASIVAFEHIGVPRDVSNVESAASLSSLATKYYKAACGEANGDEARVLEKALVEVDDILTRTYDAVFNEVVSSIRSFGGERPNETQIAFKSLLRESDLLPSDIALMYRDPQSGVDLPESHNGLGYLNLIGILMQLKRVVRGLRRDTLPDKAAAAVNLLFIEEPEAHTHPQLQRIFMSNIKRFLTEEASVGDNRLRLQTIVTTHSAHIVSSADFEDIKYLRRKGALVEVKDLALMEVEFGGGENRFDAWFRFLKQYLTLARADVFFADKLILAEGDTERILLPAMMKKIDWEAAKLNIPDEKQLIPLLSQDISVIVVGNNSRVFDPLIRFLGIKTLVITDADYINQTRDACVYEQAKSTSNYSIGHYLASVSEYQEDPVSYLGTAADIVLSPNNGPVGSGWGLDPHGSLRIGVQGGVKVENVIQHPRSFEDAFICENRKLLSEKKGDFTSLVHSERIDDRSFNSYTLANECIASKSGFAMDILLCSETADDNEPFANWKMPRYIEEGLKWLQMP